MSTNSDMILLQNEPLDYGAIISSVSTSETGAIAFFAGTTRAEQNETRQPLVALDYEAYTQMAQRQLQDLALRCRDRWPVLKLVIVHRLGRVPLGEASVMIAVSTPHRADAFAACRWLIDTLKSEVAIWKKEIWADGSATWVEPQNVVHE